MTFYDKKSFKRYTSEVSSSVAIDFFFFTFTLVPILVYANCLSASNVRCHLTVGPYFGREKHVGSHVCEQIVVFGTSTNLLHT